MYKALAKGCTVYQTLTLQLHKPKFSIPRMDINKAPFRVNDYLSDGGPPLFGTTLNGSLYTVYCDPDQDTARLLKVSECIQFVL